MSYHRKTETEIDPQTTSLNSKSNQSYQQISSTPFGPSLKSSSQPYINKSFKKIIQYEVKPISSLKSTIHNNSNEEIPNENEVYENRYYVKEEIDENDQGDNLSIVNINVSVLFSSDNTNNEDKSCTLEYSLDSKSKPSQSQSQNQSQNQSKSYKDLSNKTNNTNNTNSIGSNCSVQSNNERQFVKERVKKMMKNKSKHMINSNSNVISQSIKQNTNQIECFLKEKEKERQKDKENQKDNDENEELYDTVTDDISKIIGRRDFNSKVLIKNKLIEINQSSNETNSKRLFKTINRNRSIDISNNTSNTKEIHGINHINSINNSIYNYNKSFGSYSTKQKHEKSNEKQEKTKEKDKENLTSRFKSMSNITPTNTQITKNNTILLNLNSLKLLTEKAVNRPILKETKITKKEIVIEDDKSSSSTSILDEILKGYSGSVELINKDNKVINIININNTYSIENITINNHIGNGNTPNNTSVNKNVLINKGKTIEDLFKNNKYKKTCSNMKSLYGKDASSTTSNAKSKKVDFVNFSLMNKK